MTPLRQTHGILGSIVDPHTAYLIGRGLKTLGLRIERQNANGLAVARFLEDHPHVRQVWYPGLASHPDHALPAPCTASAAWSASKSTATANADRFIDALRIPYIGPSLGGVETIVSPLAVMGYANVTPEARLELGIRDELVRLCVGIENTDDLLADVAQALQAC